MTFGIIGYGRFGKLWAEALKPHGEVFIYDKTKRFIDIKKVIKADMIFLLVPIIQIENCCKKIAPLLSPKTIIIDACSVKKYPAQIMQKYLPKNQPIIATHPLFGPDSVKHFGLKKQKIVVHYAHTNKYQQQQFEALLKKLQLTIIKATPSKHDHAMANSQALVHFIGRGLAALKLKDQPISTPDYQSLVRINDMVNNDTWELFWSMQRLNPYAKKMRQKLLHALNNLEDKINIDPDLKSLRQSINTLDAKIIVALHQRFILAQKIGKIKRQNKVPITDKIRDKKLQEFHGKLAQKYHLSPPLISTIFSHIIKESKKIQGQ